MTQQDTQPPAETLARAQAIAEGMAGAFAKLAVSTRYDSVDRERWAASLMDAKEIATILAALTRRAGGDAIPVGEVEALAQFLHDEGGFGEAMTDRTWPEHDGDTGQREGSWVKIVPSDVLAHFRDVARRWLLPRIAATPKPPAGGDANGWDHRYRPLAWGEVILDTDECRRDDGTWVTGICVGQKAPDPAYTSHRIYRRLKASAGGEAGALIEGVKRALQNPDGEHDGWTDEGLKHAFFRWPTIVHAINAALALSKPPAGGDAGAVERNIEAQRQTIEACARLADRMEGGLNIAGAIRRLAPNAALALPAPVVEELHPIQTVEGLKRLWKIGVETGRILQAHESVRDSTKVGPSPEDATCKPPLQVVPAIEQAVAGFTCTHWDDGAKFDLTLQILLAIGLSTPDAERRWNHFDVARDMLERSYGAGRAAARDAIRTDPMAAAIHNAALVTIVRALKGSHR